MMGLVIGHVLVTTPYVIGTVSASLAVFDRSLEEAARSLGAGPFTAFRKVTMPIIGPGMLAGSIFAFIVSFGQFDVSLFLSTPNLTPLPIAMYISLRYQFEPTAAAAGIFAIMLVVVSMLITAKLVNMKKFGGIKFNPVFDIANWNLPDMYKTARAGDYFLKPEEIVDHVPNAQDIWPFATASGVGITWAFGQYCFVYRSDISDPAPTSFKSFWDDQYAKGKRATYITSNTLQMVFFMVASEVFGSGPKDMEAGFDAMRRAMPLKISDFTGNMQTLVERGEVVIGVQWEGEVWNQLDNGIPVQPYIWTERKPLLTQTYTIARYAEPMQKKLAFALMHRKLGNEFSSKAGSTFYLRPTRKSAPIPENLASKGVTNTASSTDGLWIPDWFWYLDNETEIVETVNEIFTS